MSGLSEVAKGSTVRLLTGGFEALGSNSSLSEAGLVLGCISLRYKLSMFMMFLSDLARSTYRSESTGK